MLPPLVDSHVHADHEQLAADRSRVLADARSANVVAQVVPSVSREFWPRVKAICAAESDLYPCYGLHPCFTHADNDIAELAVWLGRENPVAVGECGLDYFIAGADKARQQHLFAGQVALAREFNLPLVVHARRSVEDVIRMLRSSGHYRGVIHSFSGSSQQAHRLIDLGYHLSFGGPITYERARRLRTLVAKLPLDAILLETDSPDQVVSSHSGERNEPAWLVEVWQSLSALRDEDPEHIARATTHNAIKLFGLPDTLSNPKEQPRSALA